MPPRTHTRQYRHGAVVSVPPRAWVDSTCVEAHIVSCPWTICRANLGLCSWAHQQLPHRCQQRSTAHGRPDLRRATLYDADLWHENWRGNTTRRCQDTCARRGMTMTVHHILVPIDFSTY